MTVWRKVLPGVAVGGLLLPLGWAAPAPADASPATTVSAATSAAATSTVVDGLPASVTFPSSPAIHIFAMSLQ